MKKKIDDPVVTRSVLETSLDERLTNLKNEMIDAFREYRSEVLDRMDRDAAGLEQIREDQEFMKHDIRDLQTRVIALETGK